LGIYKVEAEAGYPMIACPNMEVKDKDQKMTDLIGKVTAAADKHQKMGKSEMMM
jgi:hypothetical protein